MPETDNPERQVTELIGIYHADGTIIGELSYWLRARLGGGHCALCEITHGAVREKADWRACRDKLGVPVKTIHLNERSEPVRAFSEGRTPCVVARIDDELILLVGAEGLTECGGSPDRLVTLIESVCAEKGLRLV